MDLSIIIVNWRVRDLLQQSLQTIFASTGNFQMEVFVVDNDSNDGAVEMVKNQFPQVHLIANTINQGYAKANNQAIRLARGRYVLLLNPDTKVFPETFSHMLKFMDQNPDCGLAGCRLLNPDETLQPSIRRLPGFWDQFLWLLKIHHFFPKLSVFKNYLAQDFNYEEPANDVQQVMGAFFFLRREVLEKIGLLDEGYWIWFEEVDYCARLLKAGWKIAYNPDAEIIHYFGQSFRQKFSLEKQKIFNRSLSRYFKKHHSTLAWFGIQCARPISLVFAALNQLLTKR